MNSKSKFYLVLVLLFLVHSVYPQNDIPIGTWRTHYSFNKINALTKANQVIYAGSDNGLFSYDLSDNSINKISKSDGLQGGSVSALSFDTNTNKLLVGYENGNLDVIEGNTIYNIDITTNSQIIGSKSINHIITFLNYAYIATDYGVLKFNLANNLAEETYRELGIDADNNLTTLKVNMVTIQEDSLYLASAQGVLAARIVGDINLLDTNNWKRYSVADGLNTNPVHVIGTANNQVYACRNFDGIFTYQEGVWTKQNGLLNTAKFDFASNSLVVADSSIFQINSDFTVERVNTLSNALINQAIIDEETRIWAASYSMGLLSNTNGTFESIKPSGPFSNTIFRMLYLNSNIYGLSGGFTSGVNPEGIDLGFYQFEENQWNNYNSQSTTNSIPPLSDLVTVAEFNNKLYVGSIGGGLLEIRNNGSTLVYDENNSPLSGTNNAQDIRVPIIKGRQNFLWVVNYASNQIHRLNTNNEWSSIDIPNGIGAFAKDMIFVNNLIWLIIDESSGGGIVVFDPSNSQSRYLNSTSGIGGLPSSNVNSLTFDKQGLVWVGTNAGVSVFTNPLNVFSGSVDAIEPIFDNRLLLSDEIINDIEVDGGDRKWIATNSGVWLFDDEADEQILFFNTQNSPLPSNSVLDIAIHEVTGEVFFATAAGIVSYRSGSSEGETTHNQVEIFPNPVRSDFTGTVGISGLASDVIVKITDVSGKLIWQTQANGGTATWRVRDYNGNRAQTGVYLIFSSTPDGSETFIGKIAIVN